MITFRRWLLYSCIIPFAAVLSASPVCPAPAAEQTLVGRVSYVEGQMLRFVPAGKDWVATVKDVPFGLDDAMYADQNGKAEFIMPNYTWVRIAGSSQIQLIALKTNITEVDVASGLARFYNKNSNALIKATTPFGYLIAQSRAAFDLYDGDRSAEVVALGGNVDFIHAGDTARYEVAYGSSSVIADASRVWSAEATVDANWDHWNMGRDNLWSKRTSLKGESVKYLPAQLQDEAFELDENGRWETVNYNGKERRLWRPTRVSSSWAPFTEGRWTEYYGDNTWIPAEPFGHVTHHYGNWVYVNNVWCWGPPVAVGFGVNWYPGRVAWIGSGACMGWVPLAPGEPYYSHYSWGPAAVLLGAAAIVGLTIGNLAYLDHAVVVPQHDFYAVNNYRSIRVTNLNRTTIINSYQASPLVNNSILKGYNTNPNRYNFTDVNVANKPHQSVLTRIEHNQKVAEQEAGQVNADTLRQNVTRVKLASLSTRTGVESPSVTNKIVPTDKVQERISEIRSQPEKIKQQPKQVQAPSAGIEARPGSMQPPKLGVSGTRVQGGPGGETAASRSEKIPRGDKTPLRAGEKAHPGEIMQVEQQGAAPKPPGGSSHGGEQNRANDSARRSPAAEPSRTRSVSWIEDQASAARRCRHWSGTISTANRAAEATEAAKSAGATTETETPEGAPDRWR